MLPPGLRSPREVTLYYEEVYLSLVNSGEKLPCIYPLISAGVALVLIYLLIDHRQSPVLRALRWPVFCVSTAFHLWCIHSMRARSAAAAFGVGLMCSWGALWTFATIIANDCQEDFSRIERSAGQGRAEVITKGPGPAVTNGEAKAPTIPEELRQRRNLPNNEQSELIATDYQQETLLFWQAYPSSMSNKRLDWVGDVFTNFRGVGWNYQTNGVPPPPSSVQSQLFGNAGIGKAPATVSVSRTGVRRFSNRKQLLKDVLVHLAYGFLSLDLIKTIMHNDPYFWGMSFRVVMARVSEADDIQVT